MFYQEGPEGSGGPPPCGVGKGEDRGSGCGCECMFAGDQWGLHSAYFYFLKEPSSSCQGFVRAPPVGFYSTGGGPILAPASRHLKPAHWVHSLKSV